jgi:Xaa-Pro aminopeptidase
VNTAMAASHREAFLDAMEDGVAIFRTGGEQTRSRDTHFKFRPDSDFWYLTAFPEPDALAVLIPGRDEGRYVLFVRPRNIDQEIWNGRRAGVEGACELYGADEAYSIEELDEHLPQLLKGAHRMYYRTGLDLDFDRKLLSDLADMHARTRDGTQSPTTLTDPGTLLHEMRLKKSPDELAIMRRAASVTRDAHLAAMKALHGGIGEWEIEALVDGTFRAQGGSGPGYTTIAAGGSNACVLHYTTNAERVGEDDCLLLDAGCELDGYTADVTRTFPASGKFTAAQRELYEVVLAAQLAGCAHVQPGNTFLSVHDLTTRTLVQGMLDIGLITGTVDEQLESGDYRKYYMHRTSHWLGLDVHDVGTYHVASSTNGQHDSRPLEPGMVLTIEPGLYVPADDEKAPERFRGIGIRIEDDVAVTADGNENLTESIPKLIDDVEAAC